MDQYTYTNCFELNYNDDVSSYLFDASFSNQKINNETDCAEYAFYNNHPSFFFQNGKNGSNKDISKCFVINYDKINNNDPDKNKKTAFNTISNLNYDFKNNINLPMYNFKEIYNEDGTKGYQPLDEEKCSSSSNPYKKSFKYFLLKSFSNNYDLDYKKLNKRPKNIRHSLLREYKNATHIYGNAIDTNKKAIFNDYFDIMNPLFKNLYAINSSIYNDIITRFINNTFKYVSTNFFGICISNNDQKTYDYIYKNSDNMRFYTFSTTESESFYDVPTPYKILEEKNTNGWITTPEYNANNNYFNKQFYVSIKYLGLPLNLLKRWCRYQSEDFDNDIMFTPKNYEQFEKIFQNFIHISFFSFLIKVLELKLVNLGKPVYIRVILNNHYTNDDTWFINYVKTNPLGNEIKNNVTYDVVNNYSFSYLDILYCLFRNNTKYQHGSIEKNKVHLYLYENNLQDQGTDLQNDVIEHFLLDLLVLNYRVNEAITSISNTATTSNIKELIYNTKTYMHPQIEKYLSSKHPLDGSPPTDIRSYEYLISSPPITMDEKLIELFKKIYLGEFRLLHTEKFFGDRIRILTEEYELIMNDINRMKTYINNIYLHSKLNNIEDYIFNEKSKLNYLFNKNSSARQKNDDLNFLINFTLI